MTTTETRCCNCDTVTSRDEAFLDLSIEIEQDSQSKDGTSVQACLDAFTNEEDLKDEGKEGGDNRFFCDRCKSLQDAKKAMRIARRATRRATRRYSAQFGAQLGAQFSGAHRRWSDAPRARSCSGCPTCSRST